MTSPKTIYLGHDDSGNRLYLVCLFNPRDPDASVWHLHTEFAY